MGVMNVWFLRWGGAPPDPRDPTAYFALVGHDFTPGPAALALRDYAARPAVAGPGAHTWAHPAITQTGPDSWELRFEGQSLRLIDVRGPFELSIDGGPSQSLTPLMERIERPIAEGLAAGEHTIAIQSPNGPPRGFIVERDPPQPWLWVGLPIILVAGLAWSIAGLMRR
jgi:hypothetical protein